MTPMYLVVDGGLSPVYQHLQHVVPDRNHSLFKAETIDVLEQPLNYNEKMHPETQRTSMAMNKNCANVIK